MIIPVSIIGRAGVELGVLRDHRKTYHHVPTAIAIKHDSITHCILGQNMLTPYS